MSKVWITRSQPGADKSALAMRAAGYEPIVAPLLKIEPADQMPRRPPDDAILLITSQNALGVLTTYIRERHWTLICVGDATADLAREHGFRSVHSVNGTSANITTHIANHYMGDKHPFWHLSGNNVQGTMVEDLGSLGFNVARHIYYQSRPVTVWPEIDLSDIEFVAIYSPLAATTFRGFNGDVAHISAVSFSHAVDRALEGLTLKSRHVATDPTEASLIRALDCAR